MVCSYAGVESALTRLTGRQWRTRDHVFPEIYRPTILMEMDCMRGYPSGKRHNPKTSLQWLSMIAYSQRVKRVWRTLIIS